MNTNRVTYDRIRAQYAGNAAGLEKMRAKAVATGRKVNGFTADYLTERVSTYRAIAAMSDEALAEYLRVTLPYAVRRALRANTLAVGR